MNETLRECCRLLSLLLEYPDEAPQALAERVSRYLDGVRREHNDDPAGLAGLAGRLSRMDLEELRQAYVEVFDLSPGCSLFMAWHAYGDTPRQGRALAALSGLYADAGFNRVPGVLPDYLPLMLEFLSAAPEWAARTVCDGFLPHIRQLGERIAAHETGRESARQAVHEAGQKSPRPAGQGKDGVYAFLGGALAFLAGQIDPRLAH